MPTSRWASYESYRIQGFTFAIGSDYVGREIIRAPVIFRPATWKMGPMRGRPFTWYGHNFGRSRFSPTLFGAGAIAKFIKHRPTDRSVARRNSLNRIGVGSRRFKIGLIAVNVRILGNP